MNRRIPRSLAIAGLALTAACSTVRYSADFDPEAGFSDYRTYAWMTSTADEQAALERINPFLERYLQRALEQELSARGFERSTEGDPDFLVSVHPVVPEAGEGSAGADARPRTRVHGGFAVGVGYPYGYAFGPPYWRYRYPYFGYGYRFRTYYPYWIGFGAPHFGFWYPYAIHPGYTWYPGYYSAGGYGYPYRAGPRRRAAGTLVVDVVDAGNDQLVWRGWGEGALLDTPERSELSEYAREVVARIMKEFPPPTVAK